jgi:zinc protease
MSKKLLRFLITIFSIWTTIFVSLSFLPLGYGNRDGGERFSFKDIFEFVALTETNAADGAAIPKWPHEKSDLLPDPDLVFGKLPNGFRYVLLENHNPKDRVSLHLSVQAGSLNEADEQQGIAHFLEHMLFCGSKHFEPGELVKYFQSLGMQFGADANAHTGFYETVYDVILPEGDEKSLEKGLLVIKDYAEGALLLPSEIDRERKVILAEKRTRDSASYRTFVSTLKFELPETRVSKRLPIGIEEVIKNADHALLKDFYDTWYRPETMILVMVGDFNAPLAIKLIEKKFKNMSARGPARTVPDPGKISHQGIRAFYHFEKEAGNTGIGIEVVKGISPVKDSAAFQKRALIRNVADRIVQDRLDALIRKPGTPFTAAAIGSGIYLKNVEYAEISGECSPENWEKTLSVLEKTLRQALTFGFTEAELERVKRDFISDLNMKVEKAPTRGSQDLARKIIRSINDDRVFQSPEQKRKILAPFIDSITQAEVNEAFKQMWPEGHRLILITGNAKPAHAYTPPEVLIRNVFNNSRGEAVSRPVEQKAVMFPYLPEPEGKGRVIRRSKIPDLGIIRIEFENGVLLNLKKTDFKANEVIANLVFGNGRSAEPPNTPGLAMLAEEVINQSGLGKLQKDEIERALAGKNTHVAFSIEDDAFFFRGKTVSKEICLLFQLFYAHLTDPAFREDAYRLSMERFEQEYLTLSQSIDGVMEIAGERFLAGDDSRFGFPPYERFKELTLDDVKSWIGEWLSQGGLEISMAGDFDIEQAVDIASKYFGSLEKRPAPCFNQRSTMLEFPAARFVELSVDTDIPKALVVVAYPTEDFWDIRRTRRFSVLSEIFSERLRVTIREKLGAAYSPYAYNKASRSYPGYGVLKAMIHIDPETADGVLKEVRNIASDMQKSGIMKDELKRSLDPLLTGIKDMRRTNGYWLNSVLTNSGKYPQQLDWSRTIMDDYASITNDDISILARKYLNNRRAATLIIEPAKK